MNQITPNYYYFQMLTNWFKIELPKICNQLFTIFDQLIWIKVVIKLIADIYDSINK